MTLKSTWVLQTFSVLLSCFHLSVFFFFQWRRPHYPSNIQTIDNIFFFQIISLKCTLWRHFHFVLCVSQGSAISLWSRHKKEEHHSVLWFFIIYSSGKRKEGKIGKSNFCWSVRYGSFLTTKPPVLIRTLIYCRSHWKCKLGPSECTVSGKTWAF